MMFHRTDAFAARDGMFSATAFAAVRISSIRIASDAIIDIIITKAAR